MAVRVPHASNTGDRSQYGAPNMAINLIVFIPEMNERGSRGTCLENSFPPRLSSQGPSVTANDGQNIKGP